MDLGFTISRSDLPEDTGRISDPVPAGKYAVKITEAGVNDTKSGTGKYIKLRLDIIGPSHEGRAVFANLNIQNDSAKAEEIGRQQLAAVMDAVGLEAVQNTDQLIGGELEVKVAIRKSEEYGDQNEVKSYAPLGGGGAAKPAPSNGGGSKPPWAK